MNAGTARELGKGGNIWARTSKTYHLAYFLGSTEGLIESSGNGNRFSARPLRWLYL